MFKFCAIKCWDAMAYTEVVPTADHIPPLVEDSSDDEEEEGGGGGAGDESSPEDDAPAQALDFQGVGVEGDGDGDGGLAGGGARVDAAENV